MIVVMFEIPTKVDYGLLVMSSLAKFKPENYCSLQSIAQSNHISSKYLSLVMIPLHRAGLVKSKEGKNGGYTLAKTPAEISVREVVEAIEGPLHLTRCMTETAHCPAQNNCRAKPIWSKLKMDIYQLLAAKSLADIA